MTYIEFLFYLQDLLMALCEEFEEECCISVAQTIERHMRKAVESRTFSSFFYPQDLLMALCEEFEEECSVSLAPISERHVIEAVESLTFSSFFIRRTC
jgi:hypothetical protein